MAYIDIDYFEQRQDVTLNDTDFPKEALVTSWITQADEEINKDLGRNFATGNYTLTLQPLQTKVPTYILFLPNTPISGTPIVSVDKARNSFSPSMQSVSCVVLDSATGMIELSESICNQKVVVTYTGGYASNAIPEDVKYLSYLIVCRIKADTEMRQELGDDTTTSISSITVRERSGSNLQTKFDRLDNEIKNLKNKLGEKLFIGFY